MSSLQHTPPSKNTSPSPPQPPPVLIIGLFALRLTHRLIHQLPLYPAQTSDLTWLEHFLRPYRSDDALARLSDACTIETYARTYPALVGRMIRQPGYRRVFMEMEPKGKEKGEGGEMSDGMY